MLVATQLNPVPVIFLQGEQVIEDSTTAAPEAGSDENSALYGLIGKVAAEAFAEYGIFGKIVATHGIQINLGDHGILGKTLSEAVKTAAEGFKIAAEGFKITAERFKVTAEGLVLVLKIFALIYFVSVVLPTIEKIMGL